MGVVYELADDTTARLIQSVLIEHHERLMTERVTVQTVFACNVDEESGEESPCLKHHGYPAIAKVQVTSYVDRVRGIPDAKLTIDRYEWTRMAKTRQQACIDHELTHLELKLDTEGLVKRDDLGRPKLKLRVHDWELSGFAEVVERHGEASVESAQIVRFQEAWGQLALFPMPGLSPLPDTSDASRPKCSREGCGLPSTIALSANDGQPAVELCDLHWKAAVKTSEKRARKASEAAK
jgi:hypothetical protein